MPGYIPLKCSLYAISRYILVIEYSFANILYNDYAEEYPKYYLLGMYLFVICVLSCYVFFCIYQKKKN